MIPFPTLALPLLAALSASAPSTRIKAAWSLQSQSDLPTLWAGHQVAFGSRDVPVLGTLSTRTDSFVLARLERSGSGFRLVQQACNVEIAKVGGVRVSMDATSLPESTMSLRPTDDGALVASSVVKWGSEDVDADGHPGMTIDVDATICDGSLYVSNQSRTRGTAELAPRSIRGFVVTNVKQSILGAKGRCLQRVAKGTEENVAGPIAYVPVDASATCSSLALAAWPVMALPR